MLINLNRTSIVAIIKGLYETSYEVENSVIPTGIYYRILDALEVKVDLTDFDFEKFIECNLIILPKEHMTEKEIELAKKGLYVEMPSLNMTIVAYGEL